MKLKRKEPIGLAVVRFWIYENCGPILLKIRRGQTLRWQTGGRCEEGYYHIARHWTFDGLFVREQWGEHGRDCDGRFEDGGESECPTCSLRAGNENPDDPKIVYPDWRKGETYHRDYTAEAAGY